MWPFSSTVHEAPRQDEEIRNRDILADDSIARSRTRWTRLLIFFLRGLALFCLVRGLSDWARILGFIGAEDAFETAALSRQVTIVLYAILNCVAGVGLWLTSAWGAVLWLTVTLCEVFIPWTIARGLRGPSLNDALLLTLVALYILLTWLSAREKSGER
jgi:fatty acid desaturase